MEGSNGNIVVEFYYEGNSNNIYYKRMKFSALLY